MKGHGILCQKTVSEIVYIFVCSHMCLWEDVTYYIACGHACSWSIVPEPPRCENFVKRRLKCGHSTEELCGAGAKKASKHDQEEKACTLPCLFQLSCEHRCGLPCHYPSLAHNKKCENSCLRRRPGDKGDSQDQKLPLDIRQGMAAHIRAEG